MEIRFYHENYQNFPRQKTRVTNFVKITYSFKSSVKKANIVNQFRHPVSPKRRFSGYKFIQTFLLKIVSGVHHLNILAYFNIKLNHNVNAFFIPATTTTIGTL